MKFTKKMKMCLEVLKAKDEKSLSSFMLGYHAGFKDGVLSEREINNSDLSFGVDERV